MKRLLPVMLLLLVSGFSQVHADAFELTPFFGYRFGGDFDKTSSSSDISALDIKSSENYGLTFGYAFNDNFELEGLWSRQDSDLRIYRSEVATETVDIKVEYFHVGGLVLSGDDLDTKRGFFSFSAGMVSFNPDTLRSKSFFSWSIGGGGKFYFNDWLGVRLQARFFPTYINSSSNGYWCGPYGCYQSVDANFVTQTEFTAGLIFRFGY